MAISKGTRATAAAQPVTSPPQTKARQVREKSIREGTSDSATGKGKANRRGCRTDSGYRAGMKTSVGGATKADSEGRRA